MGLAGQRVPIRVPRIRHIAGSEIPLRSYDAMRGRSGLDDLLLIAGVVRDLLPQLRGRRRGDSRGDRVVEFDGVPWLHPGQTAAQLRAFQERHLSGEDVVAVFLDGKTFADATMVIARGITLTGRSAFSASVETDTENATVLTPFLRSLVERGLDLSQGVLVILDGGKVAPGPRPSGRPSGTGPWCNGDQWLQATTNVVSHLAPNARAGGVDVSASSATTTVRTTTRHLLGALETLLGELDEREPVGGRQPSIEGRRDPDILRLDLGCIGVLGTVSSRRRTVWSRQSRWSRNGARRSITGRPRPTPPLAHIDGAPGHSNHVCGR